MRSQRRHAPGRLPTSTSCAAGDTLWSIAKTYGVPMERLANTNNLDSDDTLSVGQKLSIPGTAKLATTDSSTVARSTTYVVRRGDSLSTIATKFRVRLADLLGWNNLDQAQRDQARPAPGDVPRRPPPRRH